MVEGLAEPLGPGRVGEVPQDNRVVAAGGGQGVPVAGVHHRHWAGVAGEGLAEPLGPVPVGEIPQDNRSAEVSGGQGGSVGCERHRGHPPGVAGEGAGRVGGVDSGR